MKTIRDYINLIEANDYYEPSIVNKQVQNLNLDTLKKQYDKFYLPKEPFNAGSFAYGRNLEPNPHQSHTFRKTEYFPSNKEKNPFFLYIDKIKKLQGENPFVPTVSEIKIITTPSMPGQHKISYSLLNLVHYNQVPLLQLYFACVKLIKSCTLNQRDLDKFHDIKRHKQLYYNDLQHNDLPFEDEFGDRIFKFTRHILEDLCTSKIDTNNSKLKEVIDILIGLNIPDKFFDFSPSNVMFRLSGHGAQLVITDPVA